MGSSFAKWSDPKSESPNATSSSTNVDATETEAQGDRPSAIRAAASAVAHPASLPGTPLKATAKIRPMQLAEVLSRLGSSPEIATTASPPPPRIKADAQRVLTIRTPAVEIKPADLMAARRSVPDIEEMGGVAPTFGSAGEENASTAQPPSPAVLVSGAVAKAPPALPSSETSYAIGRASDPMIPTSGVVLVGDPRAALSEIANASDALSPLSPSFDAVVARGSADTEKKLHFAPPSVAVMWIIFFVGVLFSGVAYWFSNS